MLSIILYVLNVLRHQTDKAYQWGPLDRLMGKADHRIMLAQSWGWKAQRKAEGRYCPSCTGDPTDIYSCQCPDPSWPEKGMVWTEIVGNDDADYWAEMEREADVEDDNAAMIQGAYDDDGLLLAAWENPTVGEFIGDVR